MLRFAPLLIISLACCVLTSGGFHVESVATLRNDDVIKYSSSFMRHVTGDADEFRLSEEESRSRDRVLDNLGEYLNSVHSTRHAANNSLIRAINSLASSTTKSYPSSLQCRKDVDTWQSDARQLELYALQMKDSWASRETGMLEGNVRWSGQYWECIHAANPNFKPKYCTTYFGFRYVPHYGGIPYDIAVDTCFPASCGEDDVTAMTEEVMRDVIVVPAVKSFCVEIDRSYDWFVVVGIVWSCMMLLLAMAGTCADHWWERKGENKQNSLLLCFSVKRNWHKIMSTKKSSSNIGSINGVRLFTTLWVILGHAVSMATPAIENITPMGAAIHKKFGMMAIANGSFSVDTFFLLGGLLTSYLSLKQMRKSGGKLNVLMMYLHRYLRLTPTLLFVLIFTTGVYKFFGDGPRWQDGFDNSLGNCRTYWWTVPTMITNLYPVSNNCFGHAWYLACDIQYHILAPIFIYALYKWPIYGVVQSVAVTITSIGITWWLSSSNQQQTMPVSQSFFYTIISRLIFIPTGGASETGKTYEQRFSSDIYFTPWCRIGAYLVGVLFGFALHKTQHKIRMNKIVVTLGWVTSIGTGLSVVYGLYGATSEPRFQEVQVAAFYNAVSRPAWALAVGWVILACTCGYGGPVTSFLEWSVFLPLSRITYSTYLVHVFVLYWYSSMQLTNFYYSPVWVAYIYMGHVVLSFSIGFVVALLVEWPFQELMKYGLVNPSQSAHQTQALPLSSLPHRSKKGDPSSYTSSSLDDSSSLSGSSSSASKSGKTNPAYVDNHYSTKI